MVLQKPSQRHIQTERLILRSIQQADYSEMLRILANREVTQYTALSRQQRIAIEQMQQYTIPAYDHRGRQEHLQWAITLRSDPENMLIGRCGFEELYPAAQYGELGYWLAREHWSKGIMSESVSAVMKYGFRVLELQKIQAWVLRENVASIHVLKKCGFQQQVVLAADHDLLPFSILRAEFEALPTQVHHDSK